MKKLLIALAIVILVILGIFFWSVKKADEGETMQSGTLVMKQLFKLDRGKQNV